MLHYLKHAEIDFALWDNCVQQSGQNLIYAYAGYLEISTAGKWDAIVEIQEGKYVSVFPLPVKNRLGVKFIYQPFHSQQLGLFITIQSKITTVSAYLAAIPTHFRKIYLQLNEGNTMILGMLPEGFSCTPRITYHLNLKESYEQLQQQFSTNLKRNLVKAAKQEFEITTSGDLSSLVALFRETRGKTLTEIKNRHYLLFEKQYRFLQKNNLAELVEVKQKGKLLAGALFLKQSGKLIFIFSAASEAGRKTAATPFLLDFIIRKNAGTTTILDFEGGSVQNLQQFYSSFGAKAVTYLSVSKNNLPRYLKWLIK